MSRESLRSVETQVYAHEEKGDIWESNHFYKNLTGEWRDIGHENKIKGSTTAVGALLLAAWISWSTAVISYLSLGLEPPSLLLPWAASLRRQKRSPFLIAMFINSLLAYIICFTLVYRHTSREVWVSAISMSSAISLAIFGAILRATPNEILLIFVPSGLNVVCGLAILGSTFRR